MASAILAFSFALIIFGLAAEASTSWLKILGFIVAMLMTLGGAMAGYQASKK